MYGLPTDNKKLSEALEYAKKLIQVTHNSVFLHH